MGMIRVSDEVEGRLKEVGGGLSMSKTVARLLDSPVSPLPTSVSPESTELKELKKGLKELKKGQIRLISMLGELAAGLSRVGNAVDKLKNEMRESTIDRLDRRYASPMLVTWDEIKEFWDTLSDDPSHPAWASKAAYTGMSESSNLELANWQVVDDYICIGKVPVFKLEYFLRFKGVR